MYIINRGIIKLFYLIAINYITIEGKIIYYRVLLVSKHNLDHDWLTFSSIISLDHD